jgi:hypothetical protein
MSSPSRYLSYNFYVAQKKERQSWTGGLVLIIQAHGLLWPAWLEP